MKAANRYVYKIFAGDDLFPFYVGVGHEKTKNDRSRRELIHIREARSGVWKSNTPKNEFILECLQAGVEFRYEYERGLTTDEAHRREIELILHYGRQDLGTGCLLNACAGGWGSKSFAPSTIAKMRAFRHSEETRAKVSKTRKDRRIRHSQETLDRIAATLRAKFAESPPPRGPASPNWKSDDGGDARTLKFREGTRRWRARQRGEDVPLISNKGKPAPYVSPESRQRAAEKIRGTKRSDEARAKMSAVAKMRKRGPRSEETKAKISAAKKGEKNYNWGKAHSEETRAKMRQSQSERRARERVDA
jgi:hypothetical protein